MRVLTNIRFATAATVIFCVLALLLLLDGGAPFVALAYVAGLAVAAPASAAGTLAPTVSVALAAGLVLFLLVQPALASEPRLLLPPRETVNYATSDAITTRIWEPNCLNWSSLGNTTQYQCWEWANTSSPGAATYLFGVGQYGLNVTERDKMRLGSIMWLNTTLFRNALTGIILDYATPQATERFNNDYMYLDRNATQAEIGEFKTELEDVGFTPQKGGGVKGKVWNATNSTTIGPRLELAFDPLAKWRGVHQVGNHSINWTTTSTAEWTAGTLYQLTESGGNLTLSSTGGEAPFTNDSASGTEGELPTGWSDGKARRQGTSTTYGWGVMANTSGDNTSYTNPRGFNMSVNAVGGGSPENDYYVYKNYWGGNFTNASVDFVVNMTQPNGLSFRFALEEGTATLTSANSVAFCYFTDTVPNHVELRCQYNVVLATAIIGNLIYNHQYRIVLNWNTTDDTYGIAIFTPSNGTKIMETIGLGARKVGDYANYLQFGLAPGAVGKVYIDDVNSSGNTTTQADRFGSFQSPVNDTSVNLSAGEGYVLLNYSLVSAEPANTNITIQMNSSMNPPTWINRSNVTLYTTTGQLGNTTTVSLGNDTARYLQYNATFSIDSGTTSPTLDSLVVYMTRQPTLGGARWNRTWSNARNWTFMDNSTAATDLDSPPTGYTLFVGNNSSDFGGICRSSFASNNSPVNCTIAFPFGDNTNHTLSARITDVDGNNSNSTTFTVAADNEYPNSSFAYPFRANGSNITYNLSSLSVLTQVNLHENRSRIEGASLWVNVSGVADNVSIVSTPRLSYNGSGPTLTLPWEGYYFARMWVNDSVGWVNETNVTFLADLPPTLNGTTAPSNPQIDVVQTFTVDVGENYSSVNNVIFQLTRPDGSTNNYTYLDGQVTRDSGTTRYATYSFSVNPSSVAGTYSVIIYASDVSTTASNIVTASFYIPGTGGGFVPTPAGGGGGGGGGAAPPAVTPAPAPAGPLGLEYGVIDAAFIIEPWSETPVWTFMVGATRELDSCTVETPLTCKVVSPSLLLLEYRPNMSELGQLNWVIAGDVVARSVDGDLQRLPVSVKVFNLGVYLPITLNVPQFPGDWLLFRRLEGKVVGITLLPLAIGSLGAIGGMAAHYRSAKRRWRRGSRV